MTQQQIDPQAVIARLGAQVGQMAAELAMRDTLLEQAQKRIAELEKPEAAADAPA